ncbi:MAG: hypothetical protein Salg2KO_13550 [Salibacteraceae bacterium]
MQCFLTTTKTIIRATLLVLGVLLFVAVCLSFTSIPFWAHYNLSVTESTLTSDPEQVIILSGGGMPSGDGLMKVFYASKLVRKYPEMEVVIALPNDTADSAGVKNIMLYKTALAGFGVDTGKVKWLKDGYNTRTQAVASAGSKHKPTIVLTEPVHTYRAVSAFRNVGFTQVQGIATHETALGEVGLSSSKSELVEIRSLGLRYNVWSYIRYEVLVLREYTALSYYWLRGWI